MSLYFSSLNSGSNGNCYYVANEAAAILVDAGLSCRETEKRMNRLNLNMEKVKAIFISHEHGDHIKGLCVIAKKYALPVYSTQKTFDGCKDLLQEQLHFIKAFEPVIILGLEITAFPKLHDAADPHSFVVSYAGLHVGVFTDIGAPCKNLLHYFKQCQAIFLEANFDEEMLESGRYPYHLKNRIRGGFGHLSNNQALQIFVQHRHKDLKYLLLSHLSKDNNCPDLVKNMFTQHAGETQIVIAGRYEETAIFKLVKLPETSVPVVVKEAKQAASRQLSFF